MAWNPYAYGQPPYWPFYQPLSRERAIQRVLELKSRGDDEWKNKYHSSWHSKAIDCFQEALRLCADYCFSDITADIHWRIAAVNLEIARLNVKGQNYTDDVNRLLTMAEKHIKKCIDLDVSLAKGYYYRADLKCLRAEWLSYQPPSSAVADFLKAYKLQPHPKTNVEPLCQALFIAVDNGHTLKLDFLIPANCTLLLKAVLNHAESKLEHVEYLIHEKDEVEGSGIASRLSVSLADCSLGSLHTKWYNEPFFPLVETLMKMGMQVVTKDIKNVVEKSQDLKFLKLVISLRSDFTDTEICEQCLSCGNMLFASHFLSLGAKPSPKAVIKNMAFPYTLGKKSISRDAHDSFLSYLEANSDSHQIVASKAISSDCFDTFQRFTQSLNEASITSLCEQALTKRKQNFVDYLMKKCGATPKPKAVIDALAWHNLDEGLLDYLVCHPTSHQEVASRALRSNNFQICCKFASLLDKDACTILCEQALTQRKKKIVDHLMQNCGANPQPKAVIDTLDWHNLDEGMLSYLACESHSGAVQLIVRAIHLNHYDLVTRFAKHLKLNVENCGLIDLSDLLSLTKLACHPDIFDKLLEVGADPNRSNASGLRPLDVALNLHFPEKTKIIISLLRKGADISQGTTIIHMFTETAFETENTETLAMFCKEYRFPEDGKVVDRSKRTPFHLAMKHKQGKLCEHIIEILCKYSIDPDILDDHKKKAYYVTQHGKGKGDKRVKLLQEHSRKFKESQKKKRPKKSKAKTRNSNADSQCSVADEKDLNKSPMKDEEQTKSELASHEHERSDNSESDQLKLLLDKVFSKGDSYFKGLQLPYKRQLSSHEKSTKGASAHPEQHNQDRSAAPPIKFDEVQADKSLDVRFEDLAWEVECPEKVVKFLKSERHPSWIRKSAIQKIHRLAEGELDGKIVLKKKDICLYEIRLTDAARILWERAVQFSPRLTDKVSAEAAKVVHVYSEVIRIWDIVLDHDNVNKSISFVEKSHERGCNAAVKYSLLKPADHQQQKGLQYPEVYLVGKDIDQQEIEKISERIFVPAGSTKEDEYNVITFYSFTSSFVKSLLEGEHARRDFPYKEWPKEHEIINMPQHSESILLLGRSGTGKTTCCLYRLWNHFQTYWKMAENSGPTFARVALTLLANRATESDLAAADSEVDLNSASVTELDASIDPCINTSAQSRDAFADAESEDDEDVRPKEVLEHLHQVFITKNYVLCAQMKKRFYDLAAGNEIAKDHMRYEDVEELPHTISDLDDHAYPIFLTARQFFIMLDNSLEDDQQFFPRDEDGKLKEKITSSDYDHENPDTLLDLEESDSEDENDAYGDFEEDVQVHRSSKKQQIPEKREVTAFYFAEKIWPEIKHASSEKKLDPLLVWMEIKSFIKGSKDALQNKEGFLSEESYKELIGEKRASNFVGKREELYKLFKAYDLILKHTVTENLFDDCDFIHNIHTRLDTLQDLPWSIHSIYIDEVQDFTQAELALLLRCCRYPNGLFLTGDTAQSIMRGIAFRFGDLRTLFHDAKEKAKTLKGAVSVSVPKVHELTINFRSHSGILELASSIIDLLKNFFPDSFDSLPGDEGMFPGPVPVLLESSSISDLAILLRGNKRQSSSIEFGAHQVIIVQSEEAKQSLPDALKAGNVLTVFESKGLEFDDVILYDFFKNSKVTKEWRVVTSFIEDNSKLRRTDKSSFTSEPRKLEFDELQHKSLNSELKYLYTAITRAKCNLWIYDCDQDKRLPMFDYWVKRALVKVVKVDLTKDDQNVLFAVQSSKEEWKDQGDYFKKKGLWEPAMKCYWKAENVRLEMETKAYFLAQQAKTFSQKPKEMQLHFLRAAIAFLKCDESSHDVSCLEKAAKCLKNSKKHSEAARLYAKLNQRDKALAQFRRSNDIDGYVRFKEMNGQHSEAVQLYVKKNRRLEALQLATEYEQKGIKLSHGLAAIDLALKFSKFYSEKGQTEKLVKVIGYIPDMSLQVDMLKKANMYKEACDLLVRSKHFDEAYQLYRAQGKYSDAIKLAEKQKDTVKADQFSLCRAISLLAKDNHELKDKHEMEIRLQKITTSSHNREHKALACLLLGRANKNAGLCRKASEIFGTMRIEHTVGQMEACVTILEIEKDSPSKRRDDVLLKVLHVCKLVGKIAGCCKSKESKRTSSQTNVVRQIEALYALEKHQTDYACFRDEITFWMGQSFKPHQCSDSGGLLVVSTEDVMKLITKRMEGVIERWIDKDELEVIQHLKSKLKSFPFHEQLSKTGHLQRSYLAYPQNEFTSYLRLCNSAAEVDELALQNQCLPVGMIVRIVLNFFSPQASIYIPINKAHLRVLNDALKSLLKKEALKIQETPDREFNMDKWLEVWRIHCVLGTIPELEHHFTVRPNTNDKVYCIYGDRSYDHFLALWLRSCMLITNKTRVITSAKIAVHFIVKKFAQQSAIRATLSAVNLIQILCIHSTALLAMSKICSYRLHKRSRVYLPNLYVQNVRMFDLMNCHSQDQKSLFRACFEDDIVQKRARISPQSLLELLGEIHVLVSEILGVLTGSTYPQLKPLHSVMTKEGIANGDAKYCLMLTLTLFANLALTDFINDQLLHQFRTEVMQAIQPLLQQTGTGSELLKKSFNLFAGQNTVVGTFMALHQLITSAGESNHIIEMMIDERQWSFTFNPVKFQHFPQRPLVPLPVIQISKAAEVLQVSGKVESTRNAWGIQRSISQPANSQNVQESVHTKSVVKETQADVSEYPQLPKSSIEQSQVRLEIVKHKPEEYVDTPSSSEQAQGFKDLGTDVDAPLFSQYPTAQGFQDLGTDVDAPFMQTSGNPGVYQSHPNTSDWAAHKPEEVENDEDIQEALKLSVPTSIADTSKALTVLSLSGQEQSLIDETFCQICAVSLQTDRDVANSDLPQESDPQLEEPTSPVGLERSISRDNEEVETYAAHCKSQKHVVQCKLRDKFLELSKESYTPLKEKLEHVLRALQSFDDLWKVHSLIKQIEKEISNNVKYFEQIKLYAEWREGCSKIENEIIERAESLLHKSELEHAKAQRAQRASEMAARRDSQEEEDVKGEEERLEEVEDPSNNAAQQKGKSRARKRHKKKRK